MHKYEDIVMNVLFILITGTVGSYFVALSEKFIMNECLGPVPIGSVHDDNFYNIDVAPSLQMAK